MEDAEKADRFRSGFLCVSLPTVVRPLCRYFTLTSIRFVAAGAVFARRSVSTPWAYWASTCSVSTPSGKGMVRRNEP